MLWSLLISGNGSAIVLTLRFMDFHFSHFFRLYAMAAVSMLLVASVMPIVRIFRMDVGRVRNTNSCVVAVEVTVPVKPASKRRRAVGENTIDPDLYVV